MHVSNAFLNGKQSFIEGCGPSEGTHSENHRRTCLEVSDRSSMTDARALDATLLGVTVDALAGGALVGESVGKRAVAIQRHAWNASEFPVDIRNTAFACGEWRMLTGLARFFGKEERAWEAQSAKAMGVVERDGGMHGQATGTTRSAISQASERGCGRLSEGDGGEAAVASSGIRDVPCSRSSSSSKRRGILIEGSNDLTMEGANRRDVLFLERLGLCSQHHIASVGGSGSGDAGARAPKEFVLFLRFFVLWRRCLILAGGRRRSIPSSVLGPFLRGATRDTEPAIGITAQTCGGVGALRSRGSFLLLLDPGRQVRDVEGHDLAETRNLFLEGVNRASQQIGEEPAIELAQFLTQPEAGGESLLPVEAVRLGEIEDEMEAQFHDEQRVCDENVASWSGGEEALADADEEGFERSRFGMGRPTSWGWLGFPSFDDSPVKRREEGASIKNNGILIEHGSTRRRVKNARGRDQSTELLVLVYLLRMNTLHRECFLCQGGFPDVSCKRGRRATWMTCSRIFVSEKRWKEEFRSHMSLWIPCSRIARTSVSTKNAAKRRFRLTHDVHPSRMRLKHFLNERPRAHKVYMLPGKGCGEVRQ